MIHRTIVTPTMRRLASLLGIALLGGSAVAWATLIADRPISPARPELVAQIEDVRTQVERLSRTSVDLPSPRTSQRQELAPATRDSQSR